MLCKHEFIPSAEQKRKLEWLRTRAGLPKVADELEEAWCDADHFRRAYEAEHALHESQGRLLEQYVVEIGDLKYEVRQQKNRDAN